MDIQNRLYMAFIGVDEPPIQPFLCLHEGQSRLLDFALFLSQNTFVSKVRQNNTTSDNLYLQRVIGTKKFVCGPANDSIIISVLIHYSTLTRY